MSFHLQLMRVKSTFLGRNRKREREGTTWEDEDRIRKEMFISWRQKRFRSLLCSSKRKNQRKCTWNLETEVSRAISRQMREKHQSLQILLFWRDTRLTLSLSFYYNRTVLSFWYPLRHMKLCSSSFLSCEQIQGMRGRIWRRRRWKTHSCCSLSHEYTESPWDIYSLSSPTSVSFRTTSCCPWRRTKLKEWMHFNCFFSCTPFDIQGWGRERLAICNQREKTAETMFIEWQWTTFSTVAVRWDFTSRITRLRNVQVIENEFSSFIQVWRTEGYSGDEGCQSPFTSRPWNDSLVIPCLCFSLVLHYMKFMEAETERIQ